VPLRFPSFSVVPALLLALLAVPALVRPLPVELAAASPAGAELDAHLGAPR
jgi:hypothetical protein